MSLDDQTKAAIHKMGAEERNLSTRSSSIDGLLEASNHATNEINATVGALSATQRQDLFRALQGHGDGANQALQDAGLRPAHVEHDTLVIPGVDGHALTVTGLPYDPQPGNPLVVGFENKSGEP